MHSSGGNNCLVERLSRSNEFIRFDLIDTEIQSKRIDSLLREKAPDDEDAPEAEITV